MTADVVNGKEIKIEPEEQKGEIRKMEKLKKEKRSEEHTSELQSHA